MKTIILHGDNTKDSYERLRKFTDSAKSRNWDIEKFSDQLQKLPEIATSQSLFGNERLIIVEKANLLTKSDLSWLKKNSKKSSATLVIYNDGAVSKTFLNSLPKDTKVEEFKVPKLIWSFLDSFQPGNAKNCLILLHEITKTEPIEFVFALLARQLRDLYWIKSDPKSLKYPTWRIGKLEHQASKFKNGLLKEIISELAASDIKSKTSSANLESELDFVIATKLE